ncbi:uncharacterized protein [Hoplias malabaricus]|uniref:uncharacterized protein n=1 Tax=Hoplias malabaricus TaxID=27720 RepID=UPI003462EE21
MAVKIVLILVLFSVSLGHAQRGSPDLECQSAVGVVGEVTKIPCSFRPFVKHRKFIIYIVRIEKKWQEDPVVYIKKLNNVVKGGPRITLPSRTDPSLFFTNTTVSDEGEYEYRLRTSRGVIKNRRFRLRVTAEYDPPVIKSWLERIKDSHRVELHCSTSGGYPAGGIHWFKNNEANWTESATLEIMERDDKLLTMSSKLTLTLFKLSLESYSIGHPLQPLSVSLCAAGVPH